MRSFQICWLLGYFVVMPTAVVASEDATQTASQGIQTVSADLRWHIVIEAENPVMLLEKDESGKTVGASELLGAGHEVTASSFSENLARLSIATSDRRIRKWDLTGTDPVLETVEIAFPKRPAVLVQLSSNGQWLAAADKRGRLSILDLRSPDVHFRSLRQPWLSHPIDILKFSPDSDWLFSASNDSNKYWYDARLWKLNGPRLQRKGVRLDANTYSFESAHFATGGRWFVTGHHRESRIWDLSSPDPSKAPVIVRVRDAQGQKVELDDGDWILNRSGQVLSMRRAEDEVSRRQSDTPENE